MEKEIWKDIVGWEGLYEISSHGRLKSYKNRKLPDGRILKNTNKNNDYLAVTLESVCKPDKEHTRIHRIVGHHFVDGYFHGAVINHKDTNKQNNYHKNLEWVTSSENSKHSALHTNVMSGLNKWNKVTKTKRIAQMSLNGKLIKIHLNGVEAGRDTGVCKRNILQVANKTEYKKGKYRKQAGGFKWRFVGV